MITVTSINGHVKDAHPSMVRAEHGWLVLSYEGLDVFYNQDGREVFKVTHSKREPKCSFKSFVVSAITRLAGRGKISTRNT